jgi:hypothetical protein
VIEVGLVLELQLPRARTANASTCGSWDRPKVLERL